MEWISTFDMIFGFPHILFFTCYFMQAVYIVYSTAMPTFFNWSRVRLRLILTWNLGMEDGIIIMRSVMLVEVKTLYPSSRPNPH